MRFYLIDGSERKETPRYTLFVNVYDVPEDHGDYSTVKTWSSRDPSTDKWVPSYQHFQVVRASDSMIRKYPEFYMIECECGNHHLEDVCDECCEHDDTDDYCCLDCGKDLTEDRVAAAYDRWKDSKYE